MAPSPLTQATHILHSLPDSTVRMSQDDYYLPEAEIKEIFKQDVAGAKRLLAEAGLASGGEFELMALQVGANVVDIAQLVKADLAAIGINVNIRVVDTPIFISTVYTNGTHDMAIG